jgi:hypothetical protein
VALAVEVEIMKRLVVEQAQQEHLVKETLAVMETLVLLLMLAVAVAVQVQ